MDAATRRGRLGNLLDEELRLRTLYSYDILDTIEEDAFNDVCSIAATLCETPTALISLVDRRRQWFKARLNFEERETELECSFCVHAIEQGELLVVENALHDSRFAETRLVIRGPGVRFYAGAPISAFNGQRLGTLCVIDTCPRQLTEDQSKALKSLARQVEGLLELRRVGKDRDTLGRFVIHDMRNPLTSMLAGIESALDEFDAGKLDKNDLLDLQEATEVLRRRVEDYHTLLAESTGLLPTKIEEVNVETLFEEMKRSMRRRMSRQGVTLGGTFAVPILWGERELIRRLLENLIYNSLNVSPAGSTIAVETWSSDDAVHLAVTDQGPGVPEGQRPAIFEALRQRKPDDARTSTGLGLSFCALAARTIGGTIVCEAPPSNVGARFRLTLPSQRGSSASFT